MSDFFLTAIRCRHQHTTKKEYRDARRRSGEAVWSCRQGTATRGPCRCPARTFLLTSLVLRNLLPIRLVMVPASPSRRICTRFDIASIYAWRPLLSMRIRSSSSPQLVLRPAAMPNPRRSRAQKTGGRPVMCEKGVRCAPRLN